jgi:hypothetical protein
MKTRKSVRYMTALAAVMGMCVQSSAFAGEPAPRPPVVDVALSDGGVLHGQVVDLRGTAVAKAPVSLATQQRSVAGVTTAADGTFKLQGLKGGVYRVATAQGRGIFRLWSPGTAPPAAQTSAIVYTQNQVVDRNVVTYTQNPGGGAGGGFKSFISSPIFIAGVVATAVAVPVAIANTREASP